MGRDSNCIFKVRIPPLFAKWAQFSSSLLTIVEACYLKSGVSFCSHGHLIVKRGFPAVLLCPRAFSIEPLGDGPRRAGPCVRGPPGAVRAPPSPVMRGPSWNFQCFTLKCKVVMNAFFFFHSYSVFTNGRLFIPPVKIIIPKFTLTEWNSVLATIGEKVFPLGGVRK